MTEGSGPNPSDLAEREARFRDEAQRYNLVFRCDACVHFLPRPRTCTLGYPAHLLEGAPDQCFTDDGAWRFCKYFELA